MKSKEMNKVEWWMFVNGLVPREVFHVCRIDGETPQTVSILEQVKCLPEDMTTASVHGRTLTHWYGKLGKEITQEGIARGDLVWDKTGEFLCETSMVDQQINSANKRVTAQVDCKADAEDVVDVQGAMFEAKVDDWVSFSLNIDDDGPSVVVTKDMIVNAARPPTAAALKDVEQVGVSPRRMLTECAPGLPSSSAVTSSAGVAVSDKNFEGPQ